MAPAYGYVAKSDDWDRLWTPPRLRSHDILHVGPRQRDGRRVLASTFPGLAPVPEGTRPAASGPLGQDVYRQLLHSVEHRDEVGDLLLRRASAILVRCYLLAVHSGKIVGWLGRGAGVVVDDVQSFAVHQDAPSILAEADGAEIYCGSLPGGEVNDAMRKILGDPEPSEIVICPVLVKNRVIAYLVGDSPGSIVTDDDRQRLVAAAQKAGIAFEVLILKKKIVS